jgi:hypothetical protein
MRGADRRTLTLAFLANCCDFMASLESRLKLAAKLKEAEEKRRREEKAK